MPLHARFEFGCPRGCMRAASVRVGGDGRQKETPQLLRGAARGTVWPRENRYDRGVLARWLRSDRARAHHAPAMLDRIPHHGAASDHDGGRRSQPARDVRVRSDLRYRRIRRGCDNPGIHHEVEDGVSDFDSRDGHPPPPRFKRLLRAGGRRLPPSKGRCGWSIREESATTASFGSKTGR